MSACLFLARTSRRIVLMRGVSLVEMSVATAVFAAVVGSAAALSAAAARGLRAQEEEAVAIEVAQGLLARIRAGVPAPRESGTDAIEPVPGSETLARAEAQVRWEPWSPGLVKATVRLAWTGCRGNPRSMELVTVVETGGNR